MNKISLRTKLEAVGVAMFLIALLTVSGVMSSVTRTMSDTGDDFDTFIRNSKGNYWEATGSNVQTAIDDIGDDGGTVWVGSDVTLSSELSLTYNDMILDFQGNKVTLDSDISFINLTDGVINSAVRNVKIAVSDGHTASIIVLYIPPAGDWGDRVRYNLFENIFITNPHGTTNCDWTGIHLNIYAGEDDPDDMPNFLFNTFRKIEMSFCEIGILLECDDCDAWGNGNNFDDIWIDEYETGVEFRVDAGATNGFSENVFNDVKLQTASRSKDGFKNIDNSGNHFTNCLVWDWSTASSPNYEWSIASSAEWTEISTHYMTISDLCDLGSETSVISGNAGHFYDRNPYRYIIYKNTTHTFLQSGATGLIVYSDTSSQGVFDYPWDYASPSNVFIKSGTYVIANGTSIAGSHLKDVSFIGEDKPTTIIQCEAGGTFANGIFNIGLVASQSNISFSNLCFDGNGADARGIRLASEYSMYALRVDNCIFKGFTGDVWSGGIYLEYPTDDTYSDIQITNCEFYTNDYGIQLKGDDDPSHVEWSDFSHNYFYENTYSILLDYAFNCTVSHNRIFGGTWGIILDDCQDVEVSSNTITSTNGIDEQGASNYNIISLNNCRHCTTPIDINGANTNYTGNQGTIS